MNSEVSLWSVVGSLYVFILNSGQTATFRLLHVVGEVEGVEEEEKTGDVQTAKNKGKKMRKKEAGPSPIEN